MKGQCRSRGISEKNLFLTTLISNNRSRWMQAATNLTRFCDENIVPQLTMLLKKAKFAKQREAAAYALSHSAFKWDLRMHKSFIVVMKNKKEKPQVKAQVAEGLGNLYCHHLNTPRKYYNEAVEVLLACLEDRSPRLRFWSIFALGSMKEKKALPTLENIAKNSKVICKGWGSLKKEARNAIRLIKERESR